MEKTPVNIGLFVFFFVLFANLFALEPIDVIREADAKLRGKSSLSEMTIRIVRPTWEREMRLKSWSLGTEYSMVLIQSPARDKGTVFLKRQSEMWNWVPRIDRNIKLPPSMMMQSWMGTDFTNDDLVKQSSQVTDYTHVFREDSAIAGRECWKIELTPKENAPVVWGKILTWIDKKDFLQLKTEFYDEEGELVNTLVSSGIKKLGGIDLPSHMEYIPHENPGQKTVMDYQSLKFDVPLKESFFTPRNMTKVK